MLRNKVSFSPLTETERVRKLGQMSALPKAEFVMWTKGQTERHACEIVLYNPDNHLLKFKPIKSWKPDAGVYCINLELKGLNYFMKASVIIIEKEFYINTSVEFFKSERRSSFRLLTYPIYKVKAYIKTAEAKLAAENVVDFKTKVSQVNMFQQFLSVINPKDAQKRNEGYIPFRVTDLSATGMAIYVGEMEQELFQENQKFHRSIIHFENKEIEIDEMLVVFKAPYVQTDRNNLKVFKIGIKFINLNFNTDKLITSIINSKLRNYDEKNSFEDFI
ncbi:MAG: hypothetical protein JNM93_03955 [Bacteriovoracaceae bacterium]|nr:hypothetical protein [Bacteriovoracaceae bacterium]